jgi:hypothetical protein
MKHLTPYKIFESMFKLDTTANQFITDMSKVYDLRFGESFDKNKANCAWFTSEFYKWAKSKDLNVKVVYFDSNIEAHIAPMVDGKVIDFAIKQFTKNPNDNYLILIPEDYKKYGYDKFEIYDEMPKLETIFSADKIQESNQMDYGIYDWFEDIKSSQWGRSNNNLSESSLRLNTEHFIGEGYWQKITSLVDKMFNSLSKVDIETVNDRMYDVYDEIPSAKDKYSVLCIAYGNYENHDKPNKNKYNGLISVMNVNEESKLRIVKHILIDIISPTLNIGGYPNTMLRRSDEQYYVTDKKWNCVNFDIDNYGFKDGDEFPGDERRSVTIYSYDIKNKKAYSVDKVLDMYKPSISINIGGYNNSHLTGKMNLRKLESDIDEALLSILPELDYEEVVFDMSRFDRVYDDDTDVNDYSFKILLNF